MAATDDREPFDETAAARARRRCFFCEAEKSDEWMFLERLNAFVCKACKERLEKAAAEERESG
jgi:aspartyl/asparaginyl beta-hydroxylase (cupin superfamily)